MRWVVAVTAVVAILAILLRGMFIAIKEVNEPDPTKADIPKIEAFLSGRGIKAHIEKVRYIYLDDIAYVVEGQITNMDSKTWQKTDHEWLAEPKGLVRQQGNLIGFSDVSTHSRIEPHFADHWRQLGGR